MGAGKKKLVILTGAGISAESGFSTFRDSGGLWEKYDVMQVCSLDGYEADKALVINFFNGLRRDLEHAKPNKAHYDVAALEKFFDVSVITQNVDNLHERAGSSQVLHLHGELTKICDESKREVVDIGYRDIKMGERLGGTQARPFIVFFQEAVPNLDRAVEIVSEADIFVVIGSSLAVYPAASLINYAPQDCPIFVIDPKPVSTRRSVTFIQKKASEGVADLAMRLGVDINKK